MSKAPQFAIPADWKIHQLAELGTPVRGGSPRPAGDPRFFNGSYIPWLTVASLTGIPDTQLTVKETVSYLTQEGSFRSRALNPGTLIIANSGATLGIAKILGIQCCANDGIAALINAKPDIDLRYLAYFINTQTKFLRGVVATGNGQPNLNTGLIGAINIPIPSSIDEQRKIADTLSEIDDLIRGLDQLIAKNRDIQQAAMQQLLTGQRRLPGFSSEWEVKRLGDFGQCLRGVSYKGNADLLAYDTDETYRLLRSNNVQPSAIDVNGLQFVNARCVSNHQVLKPKDILICMANGSRGLVGKAGLFKVSDGYQYTFGAFMGCFRMKADAEPDFIFALFGTHKYRNYIANLLAGSSINNLRPSDIEQMEFSFPLKNEQAAIATILSDMDTELTALEARRDKAHQLKLGMMQELLTGRIRLV